MSGPILLDALFARSTWDDLRWDAFRPGIRVHWLYRSGDDGPAAALLRYEPGAGVPLHEHRGFEHILVLEGSQSDGRARYGRGALMISPPGTRHAITSGEGCVVLAIWERPVELIA